MIKTTILSSQLILQGGLIPLRSEALVGLSVGLALWCAICQVAGKHVMDNFYLLQKFHSDTTMIVLQFLKISRPQ